MKLVKYLMIFFIIIIAIEVILGELGFGNPPLYKTDKSFEYINIPNQKISKLFFDYETNSFSMRSPKVDSNKKSILILGDSVLNGGRYISNSDLVNYRLSEKHKDYNILNISAGSWGPDNAYEYLIQNGDFNAKQIILYFSSHDANDCMNFQSVVGTSNYPGTKPLSAINELITKEMNKFQKKESFDKEHGISKSEEECSFNSGWANLIDYSKKREIPISVILHPETSEINNNNYNSKGQQIISFLEKNNIKLIKELDSSKKEYYRDTIHMNKEGHKNLANIIENNILQEKKSNEK